MLSTPFLVILLQCLALHSGHANGSVQKDDSHSDNNARQLSSTRFTVNMRSAKLDPTFDDDDSNAYKKVKLRQRKKLPETIEDNHKALLILNQLVMESLVQPTFLQNTGQRVGKRRTFAEIPSMMGKVMRGLANLTVTIGRTINSENVNGSLSRLITSRLVGVSESLMGWVERSVDDLPSIPRFDAQECMKRCICEAHNQPKKYGAVGLVIQLFFPPYLDSEDTSKIVSKYQLAARYGRGENANCAAQYDGCMVNILDVLQGAINMIF